MISKKIILPSCMTRNHFVKQSTNTYIMVETVLFFTFKELDPVNCIKNIRKILSWGNLQIPS